MPKKGMLRVGALTVAMVACAALTMPAHALTDTAVDEFGRSASFGTVLANQTVASSDIMPDNPTVGLPDTVSEDVPDNATVVSPDLAAADDGTLLDLETGETVTAEELVGTEDTQPDPLAKTGGESFIPVEVSEVKNAVEESEATGNATVRLTALGGNEYGAYWGTYNNTPAFFESDGTLFAQQAKGVIDVSEWQGSIDWEAAKNAGVEGAIIRISYGWNNGFDQYALRNISECKRLGIPFGIYSYSYAYDKASATAEGADIVNLLRKADVSPGDLSYPVFYDLERWTWTGHTPPTDPAVYDEIVNAWYGQLQAAGYNDLSVYSYTSYLYGPLNSTNIHGKTRWVASYGARTGYEYTSNDRGWQYTSSGTVAGIQGNVDLNAFGNAVAASDNGSSGNGAEDNTTPEEPDNGGEDGIVCGEYSVHRLYSNKSGLHHYTMSSEEISKLVELGWRDEGVTFCAVSNGTAVYRLYDPASNNHVYTIDGNERRVLAMRGWNDEGVGWYLPVAGERPVYRLYNPISGEHLFTTSYTEYQNVGKFGWNQEGVAWYSE